MAGKGWNYNQAIEDAEFSDEKEWPMNMNDGLQIEYDGSAMGRAKKAFRNVGGLNPWVVIGILACIVAIVCSFFYWDGIDPMGKRRTVNTGMPNPIMRIEGLPCDLFTWRSCWPTWELRKAIAALGSPTTIPIRRASSRR